MQASRILLNAAKSADKGKKIPVEVYPLFLVSGMVVIGAGYNLYRKLTFGDLRVSRQGKSAEGH